MDENYWIEKLKMEPHPEGGYYKETFRANLAIDTPWGKRSALTSIFYLLSNSDFSGFHKIKSDELWYHHSGESLLVEEITSSGKLITHLLNAENPFAAIQAGSWFASHVKDNNGYVLVSCTVAPGFEFDDFEMAKKEWMLNEYPQFSDLIKRLARD